MDAYFWDDFQKSKKRYTQTMDPVCQKWGLTRAELDVLMFLANNPSYDRAADVVEYRGLTKSHVSIAARGLYEHGFVQPVPDAEDRRVMRLRLTEKAEPVFRDGQQTQKAFFKKLVAGFSQEELTQMWNLLDKMRNNMKSGEEESSNGPE